MFTKGVDRWSRDGTANLRQYDKERWKTATRPGPMTASQALLLRQHCGQNKWRNKHRQGDYTRKEKGTGIPLLVYYQSSDLIPVMETVPGFKIGALKADTNQ
jgi:hypothetical protein